jgi:hypothetical protein
MAGRVEQNGAKGGKRPNDPNVLTARQQQAIDALLTRQSEEEVCQEVGIHRSTLLRWKKLPAFQAALEAAHNACLREAVGKLKRYSMDAVDRLFHEMGHATNETGHKITAADKLLAHLVKLSDMADLKARVEELERQAQSQDASEAIWLKVADAMARRAGSN